MVNRSITLEHIIPKSMKAIDFHELYEVSHAFCNSSRGKESFISTYKMIEKFKEQYPKEFAIAITLHSKSSEIGTYISMFNWFKKSL